MQCDGVRHKASPSLVGHILCWARHPATTSLSRLCTARAWAEDTHPYNGEAKAQRALVHLGESEMRASSCLMPQALCQTQRTISH